MFKMVMFPVRALMLFLRMSGVKGAVLFGLGIGVGLLIAPQTGAELRARLEARLAEAGNGGLPPDEDLTL